MDYETTDMTGAVDFGEAENILLLKLELPVDLVESIEVHVCEQAEVTVGPES